MLDSAGLALATWEALVVAAAAVAELAAALAVVDSAELELGPAVALGLAEDHWLEHLGQSAAALGLESVQAAAEAAEVAVAEPVVGLAAVAGLAAVGLAVAAELDAAVAVAAEPVLAVVVAVAAAAAVEQPAGLELGPELLALVVAVDEPVA